MTERTDTGTAAGPSSAVGASGTPGAAGTSGAPGATAASGAAPADPNEALFAAARAVIPGGVDSPVRAYGSVGGTPRFLVAGEGPYVTDAAGRRYVDLVGSWGPAILGHAHPAVVSAVQQAAALGLSFGAPSPTEEALARRVVDLIEPVERIRFVSSGTEATMSALRLARGVTGRSAIIKFAGCYHGHVDALLAAAGSGAATFALPDSAGVPESVTRDVIVLPYGDLTAVAAAFDAHGERIAAIITEAAPANMGVVPPPPGFNAGLARLARDHGALLILDEVLTGFRVSPRGRWGLDGAHEGWRPDLMTFGKVIGGGLPVGAFGGRADLMAQLAPEGPVYQAGTLSGNPLAMTAGAATLDALDAACYDAMAAAADRLTAAIGDQLTRVGVPHCIQRVGSLFSVFFAAGPIGDYDAAKQQDTARFAAFFHAMLAAGVSLPPSAFEAWFVSAAHDDEAIDHVVSALPAAAEAAARAEGAPGVA